MSDKPTVTPEQTAYLLAKVLTEAGRWELTHPGACYKCSYNGCTTYHDYDRPCEKRDE